MQPDMTIKMGPACFSGIKQLDEGKTIDEAQIRLICDYIDRRYDCADFRLVAIIRTLYDYTNLISKETIEYMKDAILNFKYWMDEPGIDSMCYWSENHQILFAAVEYLAGQLYPEEIFTNADMTGKEHIEKAKQRIERWLYDRFTYGFIEWHSNTYYEEDVAALSILIDFCEDEKIVQRSKMIMDLLLLDMAMHSWKGLFCATSGRCYEMQKKNPLRHGTLQIAEAVWQHGNLETYDYSRTSASFLLMKEYDIPEVIKKIGQDTRDVEIKGSMGLNLDEIQYEFEELEDIDTTGMFLWAMESFTNPESIDMALKIFNEWNLYENNFLADLKMINYKILRKSGLLPFIIRLLNPVTQGIAIQRANTYTYKTKDYMLSTAQGYHPGEFADQQHIWQATLSDSVTVFTTHPSVSAFSDDDRNFSPSYWVGSGILPHSVQHKNVHMSIYDLRGRKGFMETKRAQFTHAYFPTEKFDKFKLDNNYIFGALGNVFIALIGRNGLNINPKDSADIIQGGKVTYWICEIGTSDSYSSFDKFIDDIKTREVEFSKSQLKYKGKDTYSLTYKGEFTLNGEVVKTNYDRLESPYGKVPRKPEEIYISHEGKELYLNFDKLIRECK
ncbi:MAG: hypothetical protein GX974_07530 [Clostridiales bacterium]|nr:hypothetical protein [Clostridiales bacterium]